MRKSLLTELKCHTIFFIRVSRTFDLDAVSFSSPISSIKMTGLYANSHKVSHRCKARISELYNYCIKEIGWQMWFNLPVIESLLNIYRRPKLFFRNAENYCPFSLQKILVNNCRNYLQLSVILLSISSSLLLTNRFSICEMHIKYYIW